MLDASSAITVPLQIPTFKLQPSQIQSLKLQLTSAKLRTAGRLITAAKPDSPAFLPKPAASRSVPGNPWLQRCGVMRSRGILLTREQRNMQLLQSYKLSCQDARQGHYRQNYFQLQPKLQAHIQQRRVLRQTKHISGASIPNTHPCQILVSNLLYSSFEAILGLRL